jgi:hypothetical protein
MDWTLPTNPRSENQECLPEVAFLGIPFALFNSAMSNTRAHYFETKAVPLCTGEIAWIIR